MSKTLDEIKEEVAKEAGFASFQDVFFDEELSPTITDEIAERYAKEKFNEAIELASKKAKTTKMKYEVGYLRYDYMTVVDKESILKLKQ